MTEQESRELLLSRGDYMLKYAVAYSIVIMGAALSFYIVAGVHR